MRAKAQGDGDIIDTSTHEAYQHTVVKWVGYVQDARNRQDAAKAHLDAARTAENVKSRELEGPLVAARKALANVEGPLKADVDRRMNALNESRAALDDAVHPSKGSGQAYQSQADQVQREIDDAESRIRSLRDSISRLDPGSSWYRSETSRLNSDIVGYQNDIERLSRKRFSLMQQANEASGVQREPNDPIVVAARNRVSVATDAVATAQAALRDGVAPFVDKVDSAQTAYNGGMARARAEVADADRSLNLATGETKRVEDSMREVPKKVGFFKRLKWKLFNHFDAKAYFKDQASRAGIQ